MRRYMDFKNLFNKIKYSIVLNVVEYPSLRAKNIID